MKKILLPSLLFIAGCGGKITLTNKQPQPSLHTVSVTWQQMSTCKGCIYQVYRRDGECPSTLIGSSGWSNVGSLEDTGSKNYLFQDKVQAGTYSYVVQVEFGTVLSNPSNCQSKEIN